MIDERRLAEAEGTLLEAEEMADQSLTALDAASALPPLLAGPCPRF
jgi:hypothetical protein